jgi:DNA-binding HxlR family transcriptional regulator
LEDNKLIKRKEYSEKPPKVEYTLTKNGRALSKIVDAMRSYGNKFL